MAFQDLRAWIALLEEKGALKHIKAEVDWNEEIGAITREVASSKGPGLLFENIKDYQEAPCHRLLAATLGSRRNVRWALSLPDNITDKEVVQRLRLQLRKSVEPVVLSSGPVKDIITKGNDVNLFKLPVPKWNPGDGGRYINTMVSIVTRDATTGKLNLGTYRGMIAEKNKISVLLSRPTDWGGHFTQMEARKQEMPVAAILGWDPTLFMCSGTPLEGEEYRICGVIRGEPVPLVKCETSELLVPASAEIVLEGRISPDPSTFMMEGPFAEYPGYYTGMPEPRPVIQVDCISHRRDPILVGLVAGATPGRYPSDGFWLKYFWTAAVWNSLDDAGISGITDVDFDGWPETLKVQIHKSYRAHAQRLAAAIWGSKFANSAAKIIIVADEDIDIRDRTALDWALAYRVNPGMGDVSFFDTTGNALDPSIPFEDRDVVKHGQAIVRRMLIDATINWGLEPRPEYGGKRYPPLGTEITPQMREKIKSRWKEYGL